MHVESSIVWLGVGANETYHEGSNRIATTDRLHPYWVRIPLVIPDPGRDALELDDASMDSLWEPYVSRIACSGLADGFGNNVIFYGGQVPRSWLSNIQELRGDALVAYARLLVSAVCSFKRTSVQFTWIEVCEEPNRKHQGTALLTPENHVILVKIFKTHLQHRLDSANEIKLMGPCMSHLISRAEYAQPYVAAFTGSNSLLLDAWSMHIAEASEDSQHYNGGTFCARKYVYREMTRDMMFLKWVNQDIPVFVTKLCTRACRYSSGINYGLGAPETVEHALRIVESAINVVRAGASMILPWQVYDDENVTPRNMSLFRRDGAQRPHFQALAMINDTLPYEGTVYQNESENVGDETITVAVVRKTSFGFIFGRAHQSDSLNGRYEFKLSNVDWRDSREATVNLTAFPSYVSLTGADRTITIDASGTLSLSFAELPYNCVIFGRGDVYVA